MASLLPRIEMNKPNIRRTGNIVIKMLTENIRDIFTMQYGYVTHLSHIASISKKKRTPRLYIYLSRFRDIGHKRVPYKDLVEFLGLTDEYYDKNNSGANPYTSWSKVKSLVLEQVKKEMKEMADNGEIDFWFDYTPIFPNGKTRGIPEYVEFIITKSALGLLRDENNERIVQEQRIVSGIVDKYPTLSFRTIGNLCSDLSDADLQAFEEFIVKQLPQIVANKVPRNPAGYVMGILNKWHTERKSRQQTLAFESLTGELSGLVQQSMPHVIEPSTPVLIPGDRVGEWQQLVAEYGDGQYTELLQQAVCEGTIDGAFSIVMPDYGKKERMVSASQDPVIKALLQKYTGRSFKTIQIGYNQ